MNDSILEAMYEKAKASQAISDLQAERLLKLVDVCNAQMVLPPAGLLFFHCPICEAKIKTSRIYFARRKLEIAHTVCSRCPWEWAEKGVA